MAEERQNPAVALPAPGSWRCWVLAARPRTLLTGAAPVVLGWGCAFGDGVFAASAAAAALVVAVALQTAANFANDLFDARQGMDRPGERLGPPRAVAAGLLSPRQMAWGTGLALAIGCGAGLFLAVRGGWVVLVIGAAAVVSAVLYTAGRFSLARLGLGEVFAFVFFGPVATGGTHWVQAGGFSPEAWMLGAVPGCYAVALIAVNNLRDRAGDAAAGRLTLPVRFGEGFERWLIAGSVVAPAVAPWVGGLGVGWCAGISLLALGTGVRVAEPVLRGADGRALNALLGRIAWANFAVCCAMGGGIALRG